MTTEPETLADRNRPPRLTLPPPSGWTLEAWQAINREKRYRIKHAAEIKARRSLNRRTPEYAAQQRAYRARKGSIAREWWRRAAKKLQAARASSGLCRHCDNPPRPGRLLCENCWSERRDYIMAYWRGRGFHQPSTVSS